MGKESKIGMMIEAETKDLAAIYEKLVKTAGYELEKGIEQVDTQEMKEVADMIKDFSEAKKNIVKACYYVYIMEAMEKEEEESGEDEETDEDGRRGYRGQPRSQSGRFMSRGDGRRSNRGGRGRGRRGYEDPMMMYDEDMDDFEEMERMRDMDRERGRMGYSDGSSGGGSGSSGGSGGGGRGGSSSGGSSVGGGGSRGYEEGGGQMSSRMQRGERDEREGRSGEKRRGYIEAKELGKDKQTKMKELEDYMKELGTDVTEMISDASPEEKTMLKQKMQMLMTKIQ